MSSSSIEWTELTWNPVTGCTKISPGCKFCYAETMSRRLKAMGVDKYKDGFELRLHPEALAIPFTWKKHKVVYVGDALVDWEAARDADLGLFLAVTTGFTSAEEFLEAGVPQNQILQSAASVPQALRIR